MLLYHTLYVSVGELSVLHGLWNAVERNRYLLTVMYHIL